MKKGIGFIITFMKQMAVETINNHCNNVKTKKTMATKTYAGKTVEVTEEGYFINPSDWTREMAAEIAREERYRSAHR
jgi:hypothetical protein